MSSLRTAAALLAATRSFRELAPFLPALGFGESLPLDADGCRTIGIDRVSARWAGIAEAAVVPSPSLEVSATRE